MKDEWINEKSVFRTFTFDEWVERGEKDSLDDCFDGTVITDEIEGVTIDVFMAEDELPRLYDYLGTRYMEQLNEWLISYKEKFENRWLSNRDIYVLDREIELLEYHLYPEKFHDKPEPYSLQIQSEQDKKRIPGIRKAYGNLLAFGKFTFCLPSELWDDPDCRAETMKYYLDWLIDFKNYLKDNSPTAGALQDFIDSAKDDPSVVKELNIEEITSDQQSKSYQKKLKVRQAALLLRYRGDTHMQDPQSHKLRTADSIALKLCGLDSGSSGLNLYRIWRNTVIGKTFQTNIISAFKIEPKKAGPIIRRRLNYLTAAAEFEQDSDIKERIQSDHDSLKSEYEKWK